MEYLIDLGIEIISELFGVLIVGAWFLWMKYNKNRKIQELKNKLTTERLNNDILDKVLLIDSYDSLNNLEVVERFENASVVLMKDDKNLYNIVVKNDYGSSGKIVKRD